MFCQERNIEGNHIQICIFFLVHMIIKLDLYAKSKLNQRMEINCESTIFIGEN